MLDKFSNPTLLVGRIDQENFIDIICKIYTNDQIIEELYEINLVKKTWRYRNSKSIYHSTKKWRKTKNNYRRHSKKKIKKILRVYKCKYWNSKV